MIEENLTTELIEVKNQLSEKVTENENYQQELHELRHRLKVCLATQKDLSIANESIEEKLIRQEESVQKKMNLLTEKFLTEKKKYEEKISELEMSLSREEKKSEELRESLIVKEKLINQSKIEEPKNVQENLLLKERINCLVNELEKNEMIQQELASREQKVEEHNALLQKNYDEVRNILQVKTEDLASLNEILETTRDELVVCRSELETLKAVPASDSMKGNSLFAEVEDNRRKLVNDMISLKKKYLFMKENYNAKDAEIRALQAEKAALVMKLEDETVASVHQTTRLIETYKTRIWELENRLKMEEKKLKTNEKTNEQADNSFSYLQSVISGKKKEIEELCNRLEEFSIQKILHEEMKFEIEKQLRQWRYKAMSYQAQLLAVENQPKCNECLKIKPVKSEVAALSIKTEKLDYQSVKSCLDSTSEKLLQIQSVSTKKATRSTNDSIIEDLSKSGENNLTIKLNVSSDMDETLPVAKSLWQEKSISDQRSDKENITGAANADQIIRKSALVKPEDKSQEKTQRSLRFTSDTVDIQKPKPTRQKIEKKSYPIVFISSNQLKK